MSRIGKLPVPVAAGVEIRLTDGEISVKGPHGELSHRPHAAMTVEWDDAAREVRVTRPNDSSESRALHGLTRALIANMVRGVQQPFQKTLEIQGVGYQASLNGQELWLQVGFANTIKLPIPAGVNCEVKSPTQVIVASADKQKCGQFAANIRAVRPAEPYNAKGIKYSDEQIRRKAGKAFAGA
jgi:large subunit ribosomal protein L6